MLCLALASCAGTEPRVDDPIDTLVAKLNTTYGMWINGEYPPIELPSDATVEAVLAQAVNLWGFDQGHINTYRIQKVRQVLLDTETYSAALVESDLGKKILLFKHERDNHWWTRFYDVEQEKQNR